MLNDAGNFAYLMADITAAERLYAEALTIREAAGQEALVAGTSNNLGLTLRERGDYTAALARFKGALEVNERTKHENWRRWRAMNLSNIGITQSRLGDHTNAAASQRACRDAFADLEDDWGVGMASNDLAEELALLGELDAADLLARSVLSERFAAGDQKAVAASLRCLGWIHHFESSAAHTWPLFMGALDASDSVADRLGEGVALEGLVVASVNIDDPSLGARAAGALDGFLASTGIVLAPWRTERVLDARDKVERRDPEAFALAAEAARATASRGLGQLKTALGDAAHGLDVATLVDSFLLPASRS